MQGHLSLNVEYYLGRLVEQNATFIPKSVQNAGNEEIKWLISLPRQYLPSTCFYMPRAHWFEQSGPV
jgi:hypothetical protein